MDEEIIAFDSISACEAHIAAHDTGFWMKIGKGDLASTTVSYQDGLTVALRYGWIDGQKKSFDESYWLQRFTPRTARSKWSKINCDKVDELIAAGRMTPAGMRAVDAAKADGRWDAAYAGSATATVPDDLAVALAADPPAQAFFAALSSGNRYAILYRVQDAKRPETRAARIAKFVQMCHDGVTVH
jgi:uncharacterized protein YdeI (YjbR/CyaY-like superfamily)